MKATIAALMTLALSPASLPAQTPAGRGSVQALLSDPAKPIVVVAHRGCHNAAPGHGLGQAPENSLAALEHCVTLGVEMMETDIQRSLDGHLVIMHDERVDRTTNGHGLVSEMTLEQLRQLKLRQNLGGYDQPLTDQRVLTLEELLAAAKGRITLNLDVKAPIYVEVIDAVMRAGAADLVTVKARAGIASPAIAALPPYDRVPFIAILDHGGDPATLGAVAERQVSGAHPVAFELPRMPAAAVAGVQTVAARHGVALFVNTLGDGYLAGLGGDNDSDPELIWGKAHRAGVTFFQTDRPETLLTFRATLKR